MKSSIKILMFLLVLILSTEQIFSQSISLYGEQTRGNGNNASLSCQPVTLTKTMKIIAIDGDNDGFWISTQSGTLITVYKNNNVYSPAMINYTLKPGTYWVYPNLKKNQQKASVKLVLN